MRASGLAKREPGQRSGRRSPRRARAGTAHLGQRPINVVHSIVQNTPVNLIYSGTYLPLIIFTNILSNFSDFSRCSLNPLFFLFFILFFFHSFFFFSLHSSMIIQDYKSLFCYCSRCLIHSCFYFSTLMILCCCPFLAPTFHLYKQSFTCF